MQYFPNIPSLLLRLIAINLFGHIALSGGRVGSALFALNAGSSELLVGVLIALYGLLPMLLSLTVGRWVDRKGPVVPMCTGIVSVTTGIALPALLPHVATLFATAVLCGLGFMMVSLSAQHSVGHLPHGEASSRVANFGWLSVGHSTSGILGPIIVGIAIDLADFGTAFTTLAVCTSIALALVVGSRTELSALHINISRPEHHNFQTLVATPTIRHIYIIGMLLAISWDLFVFLMPILGHRRHLSASAIGAILAAFAAGTFSIRIIMAPLASYFSEWKILRAAIVVIVLVYVAFPITESAPLFFFLAFALGAAVGCGQPNILSLLHAAVPPGRGAEAVGFRAALGNASTVFVPLLFGATATSIGLAPVFWSVAAIVAAGLPLAHRGARP